MNSQQKINFILANPDMGYEELAKHLGYKSAEAVRGFCRRNKLPNKRNNSQAQRTGESLPDMVAKAIAKKKHNVIELANTFNVSPKAIFSAIEELKHRNIVVDNFSDGLQLGIEMKPAEKSFVIDSKKYTETEFAIGFVADTHLGSKYERLDVLNALYDRFEEYGITEVFHGGNWIDGEARFNKYDIYAHGVTDQIQNFLEKYPQKKGMVTHIISGDDHEGWYVQREHVNIGQVMEDMAKRMGRNDLIDLGYMERDIEFKQPKGSSIIRVIHAGGGSAYATSYTSQKYVESLQGGEKPQMVLVGHYHKFNYAYEREVHVIQGGTTLDQTPFMRKKKLQAHVGGCVIWIKQNERGIFTSVRVEWIPFFDKKFYQYHW